NGIVDSEDRVSFSPYPDYSYSFGLNAGWKNFNLAIFFQGVQGLKLKTEGWGYDPFHEGSPPLAKYRHAWSETNPSNTVPAIFEIGYGVSAAYPNSYILQDASYLRLKNVNISYTIPRHLANKIKSKEFTIYVSGDNLLTFTKYEGGDPERPGGSNNLLATFPQVRILNLGINVKF
ncbi:MAG: hypothetical protein AB2L24_31645, partial [Mangrovibacterium sp.]